MSRWPVKSGTRGRRPRVDKGRGWSRAAVSQGTDVSQRRPKPEGAARPAPPGPRALARGSSPPGPGAGPRLAFAAGLWDLGPALPGSPRGAPGCRHFPDDRPVNTHLLECRRAGSARPLRPLHAGHTGEPVTREAGWPAPLADRERPGPEFSKKRVDLVIFAAASARTRRARLGLIHQLPRPYANIIFLQYSEKSHTRHSLKAP